MTRKKKAQLVAKLRDNPVLCLRFSVTDKEQALNIRNSFQVVAAMASAEHAKPKFLIGVTYTNIQIINPQDDIFITPEPACDGYFMVMAKDFADMCYADGKYKLFANELMLWMNRFNTHSLPIRYIWNLPQFDTRIGSIKNNLEDLYERGFSYEALWDFLTE